MAEDGNKPKSGGSLLSKFDDDLLCLSRCLHPVSHGRRPPRTGYDTACEYNSNTKECFQWKFDPTKSSSFESHAVNGDRTTKDTVCLIGRGMEHFYGC